MLQFVTTKQFANQFENLRKICKPAENFPGDRARELRSKERLINSANSARKASTNNTF